MPSITDRIENFIGGAVLSSFRGRDAKLFTKSDAFAQHPDPTIQVTSPECGDDSSALLLHHTPMGENKFPQLTWSISDKSGATSSPKSQAAPAEAIKEYLLVVEDPDAPLPSPVVHGIYYAIPATKKSVLPEDFEDVSDSKRGNSDKRKLRGGFEYGMNRMKSVWGGPKPVLGHGSHRYVFQVIGLKECIDAKMTGKVATKSELEREIVGKVVGWGMWVGVFERKLG
ncbi:MAG: hypothetical protein MMC33_002224 [Icmadophila ericetorum]|nr:hypothetical protein [Icmadophila ericetorum]